jgi:deoxyribodipyrimidine photo-lyase
MERVMRGLQVMQTDRYRLIKEGEEGRGPVVYWMSRDQRVHDNWALFFAQELAIGRKRPLVVVFCLVPEFLNATLRQYGFMLKGLETVRKHLSLLNVPFVFLEGLPGNSMPEFINSHDVSLLVTDFDPLRIKRRWKKTVSDLTGIPVYEVDAHNVVPCWKASSKQEYAAFSFRIKMRRLVAEYLDEIPEIGSNPFHWTGLGHEYEWKSVEKSLTVDRSVKEVSWIKPGEDAAREALDDFAGRRLHLYLMRNDPNRHAQSDLSPYLHFGQLSAQRIALEVKKSRAPEEAKNGFLEELIVRRELSDNFCFYNEKYDTCDAFPQWAGKTLEGHRSDPRPYLYDLEAFEQGNTHDDLWNAAQLEMAIKGKMAGYMRMYWAKKILEWSPSVEDAMNTAIYLNDRYELDGRDPNGYTGIAWSLGAVHDRAFGERNIFGKVRYMSQKGSRTKFDVPAYVNYVEALRAQTDGAVATEDARRA